MTTTMIEDLCGLMTFEDFHTTNKSNVEKKCFLWKITRWLLNAIPLKCQFAKMQEKRCTSSRIKWVSWHKWCWEERWRWNLLRQRTIMLSMQNKKIGYLNIAGNYGRVFFKFYFFIFSMGKSNFTVIAQ